MLRIRVLPPQWGPIEPNKPGEPPDPTYDFTEFLGYDVRVPFTRFSVDPPATRAQYLYRAHDVTPLSLDPLVWPSPLEPALLDEFEGWTWAEVPDSPAAAPEWTGPYMPLWEDFDALAAHCHRHSQGRPYFLVAVWRYATHEVQHPPTDPPEMPPLVGGGLDHQFLGFDVADWMISGLTNCGLPEESRDIIRNAWGARSPLNRHHLFQHLSDAQQFRTFANEMVPEHAPFYAYGLTCLAGRNGATLEGIQGI
jgi:hypothetical protein